MVVVLAGLLAVAVAWPSGIAPTGPAGASLAFGVALGGLGAASVVGVVFCWWHLRLEFRAWSPGPVTVLPFTDNTAPIGGMPSAALTADLKSLFEQQLVRCRFARVTPTPSTEATTDFLSVIDAAGDDLRGPWGAALRFTRLLAPVSAYRVSCTVQPGTPEAPFVLLVELGRVAGPSMAPVEVRERNAVRAAERAAHLVAARILPRTRLCRQAPWTLWRDRRLPVDLYDSYQRYVGLHADRYFDEAMAALRIAVRLDPGNLSLRLALGKLQERMQLYLDALLTYDDIITVAAQTDAALSWWWSPRSPTPLPRTGFGGSDTRVLEKNDPVILIARYRHALLLGLSDTLAAQWWARPERCLTGEHQTSREWRRAHLREALRTRLEARHHHLVHPDDDEKRARRPDFLGPLRDVESDRDRDRRIAAARLFFTTASRYEFDGLVQDWASRWIPWRRHDVLRPDALQIGMPWSALRYRMAAAWARRAGHDDLVDEDPLKSYRREPAFADAIRGLSKGPWPPREKEVEEIVSQIVDDAAEPPSWRARFNAACLLALPLLPDGPAPEIGEVDPPPELDEEQKAYVADRAVGELVKAVQCADTDFVIRQRDWLLSEDPDLDHLRELRQFRDFEATTFGSIGRAAERGPDIHRWEQSTYVARFVSAAAQEMAVLWRNRQQSPTDDAADWRVWLEEEMAGWGLAERLALDSRDSHTREDVARRIAETGRLVALQEPYVRHPHFTDVVLDRQLASMDGRGQVGILESRYHGHRESGNRVKHRVLVAIRRSDERLSDFAHSMRDPLDDAACGCTLGQKAILALEELTLRNEIIESWLDEPSAPATLDQVRAWTDIGARRWEALSAWFNDESFGHGTLETRRDTFRALLEPWWAPAPGSHSAPP
ncbi:hypothetical protein ACQPX6_19925 [Actinomycetospora sp. CA-101289]|uniref:hypothetical protein n=1 Tax=Actinomycetospora sp. CA-101289 TaxID=3239893 RepID=UPI003D95A481